MTPDLQAKIHPWRRSWRLALIALVFAFQQVALAAHLYEHDIDADHDDCHICVVAESSAGLPVDAIELSATVFPIADETQNDRYYLPVIARRAPIRAPPFAFS